MTQTGGQSGPNSGRDRPGPRDGSNRAFSWPPHLRGPARKEYWLTGGGAGLLAISTALPWVNVRLGGSVNLFRLTSATNSVVILPWALLLVGIGIAVATFVGARVDHLAWASGITVVVALLAGGSDLVWLIRAIDASDGAASLDIGFFAAIVALVLLSVGAFRVHQERSRVPAHDGPRRGSSPLSEPRPADLRPGWKPDPWGLPGRTRYWDGRSWTPDAR